MNEIVNPKTLRDLEFGKVKAEIEKFCASPLGRSAIGSLWPSTDIERIKRELHLVQEMQAALDEARFSIGPMEDLEPILVRAREMSTLGAEELLPILKTLESGRELSQKISSLQGEYPGLRKLAERVQFFRELEGMIRRTFDDDGEMREDASPRLRQLHKQKHILEERVVERLKSFLYNPAYANMIQENVITRRSNRLVIPIKSAFKHDLDCVVHDSSDSGQTLYIEPRAVLEANNEIRELDSAIRDERLRILRELTQKVQQESRDIRETLEALKRLDGIYARARYGRELRCITPRLNAFGRIKLINARHPLINPHVVVPIDLEFGTQQLGVLVTGPNTGGKTVTLKTVGVLCLMAQSGIPIPAEAESELSLFESIRSDIGDEQSIQQNLSTFSSHMRNLVKILAEVGDRSLVLIDEIGAGTDPQEGAALGISIIRNLLTKKSKMIITTHFSALKHFAYQNEQLKTCSVEFDVETLKPTYRLVEGVGASNAFIVAERLGLDHNVVQDAMSFLAEGAVKAEEIIRLLEKERVALSEERTRLAHELESAQAKRQDFEQKLAELETRKEKHLRNDLRELERRLKETRRRLEHALHESRRASEEQIKASLKFLEEAEEEFVEAVPEAIMPRYEELVKLEGLRVGSPVYVAPLNQVGRVREIGDGSSIEVDLQGLRVRAKLADLRVAPEKEKIAVSSEKKPKKSDMVIHEYSLASPGIELHLRGMRVSEALHEVDMYLDRLVLSGMDRAFIIHGKGTGTLRRAIQENLKSDRRVKRFYPAVSEQGGDGITIVEL